MSLADELQMRIEDLKGKLHTVTREIRSAGLGASLSLAELFATRRAAHLPVKVRQAWNVLNALEPQTIGHVPFSYASPTKVIFPLSDKSCAAAKQYGIGSPEHNAAKRALHDAMYGKGNDLESYNAAQVLRRREAANVGY